MTTLRLDIPDEKAQALEDAARRLGVSVEDLLHATIDEALESKFRRTWTRIPIQTGR